MNYRYDDIPVELIVSGEYQRPVEELRASRIALDYKPEKMGAVLLSDRGNGVFAVLDGQHRVAAARKLGIEKVHAEVLSGLTLEQEADYFRFQNENMVSLRPIDRFRAGVCAKDPHYLTIKAILDKHGYTVARETAPHRIAAVNTLSRIVQIHGFTVLDRTFTYISATWPSDTVVIQKEMLVGIAEFASRFWADVAPEQFAARLSTKLPSAIRYEYERRTEGRGGHNAIFRASMRFTLCAVIVEAYNKGLGSKSRKRLKLEWKDAE